MKQSMAQALIKQSMGEIPILCNTLCSMNLMNKAIKGKKKALCKGLLSKTMIDQFIIDLYGLSIPELPSIWQTKTQSANQWKQLFNPSKQDYLKYGYLPNFVIVRIPSKFGKGWYVDRLTIQASAPKVIFGTNYYGIKERDYEVFIRRMIACCQLVGLPITQAQLEQAILREIAFCFNFIFGDSFPYPQEYLKRMGFLDIGKRYDEVKNTDFIESTHGYQGKYYNGQVGWGIYDQRARIISQAKTQEEMEVAEKMKNGSLPDKIARMEVTYQNQNAVKQHLTTWLGGNKKQSRHLEEVFNKQLSQGILTDIFNKFANEVNVAALEFPIMPQETALRLSSESGMSQAEAYLWLAHSLCMQQTGSLQLKEMLDRYFRRQYRSRLEKSLAKIIRLRPLPKSTLGKIFDECRKQLKDFKIPQPNNISYQRLKIGQLDLFAGMSV